MEYENTSMEYPIKEITINNKKYIATIERNAEKLYVTIMDRNSKYFISDYYPSTQSFVYCIKLAAREFISYLSKLEELNKWDGIIEGE